MCAIFFNDFLAEPLNFSINGDKIDCGLKKLRAQAILSRDASDSCCLFERVHEHESGKIIALQVFFKPFSSAEAPILASLSWNVGRGKPLKENRGERWFHAD